MKPFAPTAARRHARPHPEPASRIVQSGEKSPHSTSTPRTTPFPVFNFSSLIYNFASAKHL
ncbi:MAG: hypothetical protein LBR12_04470, partial [Opitutaceae bacterium]|nr:hypothetical protein [Opitutaceae bacterium]